MEWICGIVVVLGVVGVIVASYLHRQRELRSLWSGIKRERGELSRGVELWFLVQPCPRCHEFEMKLLDLSPNGRSVHYQCVHCKKKSHAAASSPKSDRVIEAWNAMDDLVDKYNRLAGPSEHITVDVYFDAPAAPLPYEQTRRTPIPEAFRTEVWRRDGGQCVKCGSRQNL